MWYIRTIAGEIGKFIKNNILWDIFSFGNLAICSDHLPTNYLPTQTPWSLSEVHKASLPPPTLLRVYSDRQALTWTNFTFGFIGTSGKR